MAGGVQISEIYKHLIIYRVRIMGRGFWWVIVWQSPGVERRLTTSDEDLVVWCGVVWQSSGVERHLTTSVEDFMAWQSPMVERRLTTSVENLVVWRGWWYDSASSEGFVYTSLPVWAGAECGKVPG